MKYIYTVYLYQFVSKNCRKSAKISLILACFAADVGGCSEGSELCQNTSFFFFLPLLSLSHSTPKLGPGLRCLHRAKWQKGRQFILVAFEGFRHSFTRCYSDTSLCNGLFQYFLWSFTVCSYSLLTGYKDGHSAP